jgi:CxxC motif-containing protein (DUF1111 family)
MTLLKSGSLVGLLLLWWLGIARTDPLPRVQADTRTATEAPTGFDETTNGVCAQDVFESVKETFGHQKSVDDGIGPVYDARSCADCHANPVIGGNSQIFELRAGHFANGVFTDHPGGSHIHSRAINAAIQERVLDGNEVRAFRASTSVLGLGFVEAIADQTLVNISNNQASQSLGFIHGQYTDVPIAEAPGATRVGRFGWKAQQASLLSFAGEAYSDNMGITTPLFPVENTSNGSSVAAFDSVPAGNPSAPDDNDNDDLEAFALFMRSTMAPPRDIALAATQAAVSGANLFNQIGCATCHVATIVTAPAGSVVNGGNFTIPPELGNKLIHPYSDFLLHNIGVGDGIQQGVPSTRNKVRTVPLWGLRTRGRFMHDGLSLTMNEAILRHAGEATFVILNYRFLSTTQRSNLLTFLRSL